MSLSPAGNWSRQVSRKSLRAPWALINGIFMGAGPLSSINLDRRRSFYLNLLFQFIVRATSSGLHDSLRNFIACDRQRPLFVKKQIGAEDRGVPTGAGTLMQPFPQRDAGLA